MNAIINGLFLIYFSYSSPFLYIYTVNLIIDFVFATSLNSKVLTNSGGVFRVFTYQIISSSIIYIL